MTRFWREEGRALPFMRDLFDLAASEAKRRRIGLLVYANGDNYLFPDTAERIVARMTSGKDGKPVDVLYCHRRDLPRINRDDVDRATFDATPSTVGSMDLFAFRLAWWRRHSAKFQQFVHAVWYWDTCLAALADKTHPGRDLGYNDLVAHERHSSAWESMTVARRWNVNAAVDFCAHNKVMPAACLRIHKKPAADLSK